MKSSKIFSLVLVSSLLLGGCFNFNANNNGNKVTTEERTREINTQEYDFTVTIPREWDMIEQKDFTKEVPPETVVVFRNNVKNEDWTATVVVTRASFQNPRETLDAAKYVMNREKTSLYDFRQVREPELRKIKIGNQEVDTYVNYFEGKKGADELLVQFIQTYASRGNTAYIVTGAVSPQENENNRKTVEDIVKSFALK